MNYLSLLVVVAFLWTVQCQTFTKIVRTHKGYVQGRIRRTIWHDVPHSVFCGIPYAQPPVGDLRFKDPKELEPWTKVKITIQEQRPCVQYLGANLYGQEDCLYLNVYTPVLDFTNITSLKPVMVWIFGGGMQAGSSGSYAYNPNFFTEEDVVFVSMNYRLGALGFLALGLEEASGNQGLKDQTMVLHWVQKNIAAFGGDPNQVTIFGESAGASSVGYHMISERSKGLFHKAILQSASPLNPWAYQTPEDALHKAYQLAKGLGFMGSSRESLLQFLKQTDLIKLMEVYSTMLNILLPLPILLPFVSTMETSGSNNTFLDECPISRFQAGKFHRLPYLLGYNKDEAIVFATGENIATQIVYNQILRQVNTWTGLGGNFSSIFNGIRKATFWEMIRMASLYYFAGPTDLTQRYLTRYNGDNPVYFYHLSYESQYNFHKFFDPNTNGTSHADDLTLLFHFFALSPVDPADPFNIFRKKIVAMWANFAKYGDPTPTSKLLGGVKWLPSGKEGYQLEIGNDKFSLVKRVISGADELFEKGYEAQLPISSACKSSFFSGLKAF